MNASFLLMALGVFFSAAFLCAALIAFVQGPIVRFESRLSVAARGTLWLILAAAPATAGATALATALLPSFGLAADHCLLHGGHHPHLCLHHPQDISFLATVIAVIGTVRVVTIAASELRAWARTRRTTSTIASVARTLGPLTIFPSPIPTAFVLGTLRPKVFVSEAMMQLPNRLIEPALAHERCHANRRHLLTRLLARLLAALHVPLVARQIMDRLAVAQELEADAAARSETGDGVVVAESLLRLARAHQAAPAGAVGFSEGALHERVTALLDSNRPKTTWPITVLTVATLSVVLLAFQFPDSVHHAFETALGWLS